jgi:hypothetical protein
MSSFSDLIDWSEFTDPFFWIPLVIIIAGLAYYFFSPTQTHQSHAHQIVLPSNQKPFAQESKQPKQVCHCDYRFHNRCRYYFKALFLIFE